MNLNKKKFLKQIENVQKTENFSHFFENREKVEKLLDLNDSISKLVILYNSSVEAKISLETFKYYCNLLFPEKYKENILRVVFEKNKLMILFYYYTERITSATLLYKKLKEKGSLKTVKRKRDSHMPYIQFKNYLEKYFQELEIVDFTFDDLMEQKNEEPISPMANNENFEIKKRKVSKTKKQTLVVKKEERIEIELLDGNFDRAKKDFLKASFITKENEEHQYFFIEKNRLYVRSHSDIKWEELKEKILNNKEIPNYSLVFYDNSKESNTFYVYRIIDKELFEIDEVSSLYLLDNLEYFKYGLNKTIQL